MSSVVVPSIVSTVLEENVKRIAKKVTAGRKRAGTLTSGRMTVSKYKKQKERALEKRLIAAFGNLNAASYKHGHARFSEGASGDLQESSNGR